MYSLLPIASLLGFVAAKPLISPTINLLNRADSGCSASGTASCTNTSSVSDLCCFESPGGLLVQPQFWDTNPSTGPSDSWTIHGLWPDHCDSTYDENCDPSRAYTDIAGLLSQNGASSTLSYMQTYWVDINGDNESFWEHEWAKHGTCMRLLYVGNNCLPSGSAKGAEAVAYFETAVKLFKTLPTYEWLANQGITPSSSVTYSLSTLTSALSRHLGATRQL
ncbi:ribonuclease T2 [Hymenopellis radicata]|nr:ribonuclease T2 [Hymenopellis radicata]